MLLGLRDKHFRAFHAAMTGAAGDGIGGPPVAQLCEVFGIEVVGHLNHHAGLVLDRVGIGGEVVALGLRVSGVTERTVGAEVALILMHDLDDFVSGNVFGEDLDIGWIGTRSSGRSRGLRCGSRGGRVLSQDNMGR